MKYLLLICCALVSGCVAKQPSEACRIDVVIQNLGQKKIRNASIEFESGDRLSVGSLSCGVYKTVLYTQVPISAEMRITCESNNTEKVYRVNIGKETVDKLSSGQHTLYIQIDMDEDEVLFKCFSGEFPFDVMHSGKKLTGAIKATPIPRGAEGSSGSESSNP
jgi:hypothetical protein